MSLVVFGPFQLDTRSLELSKNGRRVPLRPQPCRMLAVLVSQAGQLVTREQLRDTLWPPGVFVQYNLALNSCVKQLRRALDDTSTTPVYLETLTGRGYRFLRPAQLV